MIFHLLTAVLLVMKALEMIDWSWWIVLAPSLVVFGWATLVVLISPIFIAKTVK